MTGTELGLCLLAVVCSSTFQLVVKAASKKATAFGALPLLVLGAAIQLASVLLVVLALRTMRLSQLVPFAAIAYLLVPIGGQIFFRERLLLRFWLGALLIVIGISYAAS